MQVSLLHNSTLKEAIIKVIAYFDTQKMYMTQAELVYHLEILGFRQITDIEESLGTLIEHGTLKMISGYIVCTDRDLVDIEVYKERFVTSWQKIRQAYPYLWGLSLFPFVRAIAIGNTVAMYNAHTKSDVDLVIFSTKKFLWINRFLITFLLRIFRLRPEEGGKVALCPSFFLIDEPVSLGPVQVDNDIYLYYWLEHILPMYAVGVIADFRAQNQISTPVSRNLMYEINHHWIIRIIKRCIEFAMYIPWLLVHMLTFHWQKRRIHSQKKDLGNTYVVANESMIKLHYDDAREHIRDQWIKRHEQFLPKN